MGSKNDKKYAKNGVILVNEERKNFNKNYDQFSTKNIF